MRYITLLPLLLLSACGQPSDQTAEARPVPPASRGPAAPAPTPAPSPAAAWMDKAALAQPCLLSAAQVGAALGIRIDKTEPESLGDMAGCSYRGPQGTVRLNFIWHDPAYFPVATQATRRTRPGDKIDLPGDPDQAWMQFDAPDGGNLHYYRQNVEVELVTVLTAAPSRAATQAALLKLPRVP